MRYTNILLTLTLTLTLCGMRKSRPRDVVKDISMATAARRIIDGVGLITNTKIS